MTAGFMTVGSLFAPRVPILLLFMVSFASPLASSQNLPYDALDTAIQRAKVALLSRQRSDGSWEGDIVMASRHTAYYIIASNYVQHLDHPYYDRALAWLAKNQSPKGTWGSMVAPEPVSASNTAAGVLALELAGVPRHDERLSRARDYLTRHGGIDVLDPLVQAMYAAQGRCDWDGPALSQFDLTALLLPDDSPGSLRKRPPWWRETFVPIAVLRALHRKKTLSLPERQGLRVAEEWLISHQLSDGSWFTSIPTFFAIMALHDLDSMQYQRQIEDGFRFLRGRQMPNGYQRPFQLSVWDTSTVILALRAAGHPRCDLAFQASIDWLVSAQSPGGLGLSECVPGGWSYNTHSLLYPDGDDTSLSLLAMSRIEGQSSHSEYQRRVAVERAKWWILQMQGADGGWATFLRTDDRDADSKVPTGIEDRTIPDITGHALSALGALGYTSRDEPIRRAITYLQRSQTTQGSWYGRWGLCYLYGTAAVLKGLHDVGADMRMPFVKKAVGWLESQQNTDGGWGEVFDSWDQSRGITYTAPSKISTAEQTAWVVVGLLSAGRRANHPTVVRGVKYLLATQTREGQWPPDAYTVLGIDPYSNSLYSTDWPLIALGLYRQVAYPHKADSQDACEVFTSAHQSLPSTVLGFDSIGEPLDLALSLSSEGPGQVRLWIENKSGKDAHRLAASIIPEGFPDNRGTTWSADSLEAGKRSSWLVQLPNDKVRTCNLSLSYLDVSGHQFRLTRTIPLAASEDGSARSTSVLWGILVLITFGLAAGIVVGFLKYRQLLRFGFRNLGRHHVRTALTGMGLVLGTAAIASTLTLSLAFRAQLVRNFATFGTRRLIVLPYQLEVKFGPPSDSLRRRPVTHFSDSDAETLKGLPQVVAASPFVQEDLTVTHREQALQMTIRFVDPQAYEQIAASRVEKGRFLHKGNRNEVVLGYAAAHDSFDGPLGEGDLIQIEGKQVTVVGIMAEVGGIRGRLDTIVSPDIVLYAPLETAIDFTGRSYYDGIEIRTETETANKKVARLVEEVLKKNHASTEFSVLSSERLLDQVKDLLSQFTAIIVIVSLLTLLVSGVGVANMMLISVRERVTEIGVMKAIGATDRTVLMIFLAEAAGIGVLGALPGCALGYLLLLLLHWIAGVTILPVAVFVLVFSVLFSLSTTLAFGTYPAYLAARLEPVEAIRRG